MLVVGYPADFGRVINTSFYESDVIHARNSTKADRQLLGHALLQTEKTPSWIQGFWSTSEPGRVYVIPLGAIDP
jgi:hypothetical protein